MGAYKERRMGQLRRELDPDGEAPGPRRSSDIIQEYTGNQEQWALVLLVTYVVHARKASIETWWRMAHLGSAVGIFCSGIISGNSG